MSMPAGFPCVSVLVPVYNEVSTIALVIERVLRQDVVKEVVVVDDGLATAGRDPHFHFDPIGDRAHYYEGRDRPNGRSAHALGGRQRRAAIVRRPIPNDDPEHRCPDIGRARSVLRFEPRVPIEEGLCSTYADFEERFSKVPELPDSSRDPLDYRLV